MRWAVVALVVSLVLWIWRSWTNPRGLVDLHVLKDRNFRTGCFLISILGMCIYITIAILPLYYQEIMGYTAFSAGMVVGPRGIGSFIGSSFIGVLGSRIDTRKLMCAGFLVSGVCSFRNCKSLYRTLHTAVPIMLTGFALGFVFVPIATMITSTIRDNEMGAATGLSNMFRNIGGSVGIAMATTALIRRSACIKQTSLETSLPARLNSSGAAIIALLGYRIGPPEHVPVHTASLWADAATVRDARLCRCFPWTRCWHCLRRSHIIFQEANKARSAPTMTSIRSNRIHL